MRYGIGISRWRGHGGDVDTFPEQEWRMVTSEI